MTENKDLFWACRGVGGGNLGINTSFNISVFPANEIVVFKINWSNVSDQFLENMFAALESSQRELGHQIYLKPEAIGGRSSSISAYMFGQFAGPVSQFNEIISQINSAQSPSSSVIQELPYWEGQRFISDTGVPAYYRFRSRFVNSGITHQMISLLRRNLANWKNTSGNGYVKLYQTGGAVNDIAPEATAFVHRSSQWMADVSIDWKGGQSASSVNAAQRWQDHFYNEITKLSGGGAYQNFVDRTLKDWEKAYYGQNADRLKSIKLRVDPDDQFHFQQSIRL
jgi:FAD/FMN-containing dehydrogenase